MENLLMASADVLTELLGLGVHC